MDEGEQSLTLLPEEGQVLEVPATGRRYRLTRRLGGGKFSEVWAAETLGADDSFPKEVAVKIKRPELSPAEAKLFENEVLTLQHLAAEIIKDRTAGTEEDLPVPEILDLDIPGERFFVETVASGTLIDQHMRDRGALPEPEVLAIGEQLVLLLRILHERLRKSYYDFQPRNLFWDPGAGRLTVLDWNLLAPLTPETQSADLEQVATLLYRLAIGRPPGADPLWKPEGWDHLTPGFQAFLLRGLSPKGEYRYAKAREMEAELRRLRGWWGQPPAWLVETAVEKIASWSAAEDRTRCNAEEYRDILTLLEIARRKGEESAVSWLEEIYQRRQGGETFIWVRDLAVQGMYEEATQALEGLCASALVLPERLEAERWRGSLEFLAGSPGLAPEWVQDLVRTMEQLSSLSWKRWLGTGGEATDPLPLSGDRDGVGGRAEEPLGRELAAWRSLGEADRIARRTAQECREAAKKYKEALGYAASLPYGDLLTRLWGPLDQKVKKLEEEAREREKREAAEVEEERLRRTLQGLKERDAVVEQCARWLAERPGDMLRSQLALEQAEHLLARGAPEATLQLADRVVLNLAPEALARMVAFSSRAREVLFWEEKIAWVEHQWVEMQKVVRSEEDPHLIAQAVITALFPEEGPGGHPEERNRVEESLRQILPRQDRDRRWSSVLGMLRALVEHLPYIMHQDASAHLSERTWRLLLQMISSERTPAWAREELQVLTTRLRPDAESAALVEQEVHKSRERATKSQHRLLLRLRMESLRKQAEQLASQGKLEEAIDRIRKALEIEPQELPGDLREVLSGEMTHYREQLSDRAFEALIQEVQRLQEGGHLDVALYRVEDALQQGPPAKWAQRLREQKRLLEDALLQGVVREALKLQETRDYERADSRWEHALRLAKDRGLGNRIRWLENGREACQREWYAWRLQQARQAVEEWIRTAEEREATDLVQGLEDANRYAEEAVKIAQEMGDRQILARATACHLRISNRLRKARDLQRQLEERLRAPTSSRRREVVRVLRVLQEHHIWGIERPSDWPVTAVFYAEMQDAEEALRRGDLYQTYDLLKRWHGRRSELGLEEQKELNGLIQQYQMARKREQV